MTEKMFELADRLAALRERKKEAEQAVKDINAQIDDTEYALSNLMAVNETQNFTRAGIMFCLTNTVRASAEAGQKDELYAALRAHGLGDLVYETVNSNSLSAAIKEEMAENGGELPGWAAGLIKIYEKTTVGVRTAAKK